MTAMEMKDREWVNKWYNLNKDRIGKPMLNTYGRVVPNSKVLSRTVAVLKPRKRKAFLMKTHSILIVDVIEGKSTTVFVSDDILKSMIAYFSEEEK